MTSRRVFLGSLAAAALRAGRGPMKGIFPIVQTPFTSDDRLDTATLGKEIKFLDQCRVHGVVWPQLASEWATLSADERAAGAEAVVTAARGTRLAVVLGVQAPEKEGAVKYAKLAGRLRPDGIIALPPSGDSDPGRVLDYYRAIAAACPLPLFVQSIGEMSVEFVRRMAKEIPTLRYVKDEAGHTLSRISEYRRTAPELSIFTGAHGRTLIDEMSRGASGSMPASGFGDLYIKVWDAWQAGRAAEAMEAFSRVCFLVEEMQAYGLPAMKYILHLRGVFPNWACRNKGDHFDKEAEQAVRRAWEFASGAAAKAAAAASRLSGIRSRAA
jgi:4-hydroxy-tetrahydrodipicolinate synthase